MYILSVLLLLMTIPAMIYGVYRWIRYRKKETRRLKGKHIFFLSLRTCLVSFKNYLQEGQYHHLKTAVKGAFTVFPKSPTFV